MTQSEIVLAPGSGRPISLSLYDGNNEPIDFSVGTWSAWLIITPYPKYDGTPFGTLTTVGVSIPDGPSFEWLSLTSDSQMILVPDGDVTPEWKFTRHHYEAYVKGPNLNSKQDRVGHGPFRMDW